MTLKRTFIFLFFLILNLSYSQEKEKSTIIQKDLKIDSSNDIIDIPTNNSSVQSVLATKEYSKKTLVYYNGKFFPADTIHKIKNIKSFTIEIIKIPNTITKDIQAIIYLKKAAI